MGSSEWQHRLAALSVALIAGLLLGPFVGLDPARGVTISNAPFSDGAWNLLGARNLVLFGHPSTDEWRTWILTLPFTGLQAAFFAVFGVKLEVARLGTVAVVATTGALIAWALAGPVGHRSAWIAGVAYVTSALVLYYGRLAFLEPLVGALLLVGLVSLVPAARARPTVWGLAGGAALALAVMTKALAVGSAAAVVLVVAVAALRVPWARRWLAGAVPIAGALAAAWGTLIIWPRAEDVATVVTTIYPPYRFPADLGSLTRNLAALPFSDSALVLTLPLLVLALTGGVRVALSIRRGGFTAASVPPVAAAAALLAGVGLLGVVDYQPNRYVVAFLPAAAMLGAWALPNRIPRGWRSLALPAAIAALVAAQGLVLHVGWLRGAGSEVARMQAAARASLPAGATVVGMYAPLVALEVPVLTIVPFETVNDGDHYAEGARYMVWGDEPPPWAPLHAEAWAARRAIACMTWTKDSQPVCLYELPDPPG